MAATVTISESNTAGETETASIANSNMGSTDDSDLVAATYPITANENSYEKWQRFKVTALGGSTAVKTLKVWRTTALSGSDVHLTNCNESAVSDEAFATPVASTSTVATETMPTTEPTGANLGISGSLTGEITTTISSDYIVHQLQVDTGTTAGASCTMNFQYDEVA